MTFLYYDKVYSDNTGTLYWNTLNQGDSFYLAPSGSVAMTGPGSNVLNVYDDATMTVAGTLLAYNAVIDGDHNNMLTVTKSGQLISLTASAISAQIAVNEDGFGQSLNNAGQIIGHNNAIAYVDHQISIVNSGTISMDATSSTTASSVTISAELYNPYGLATNGGSIQNTGVIQAAGHEAIGIGTYGSAGLWTIYNSGSILAPHGLAISGSDYADTIVNDGTIVGDIVLNDGDDSFDGSGGTIHGIVYGGDGNDTLIGGAGNDTFDGGTGADSFDGGAGVNTVTYADATAGVVANLAAPHFNTGDAAGDTYANIMSLVGSAYADTLTGDDNANLLNGSTGADTMTGGLGNDIYVVDNVGDLVVENVNEGIDLVHSTISYTLTDNVERLTLDGTAAINGTGNALANIITGNSAANILDGGAGADVLVGGAGNDTYYVDNAGDVINETGPSTDIDTVHATVSWTLGANLENLVLDGTAAINGTGNALANTITGNAAANVIDGGAGADTMIGGQGNDIYYVDNVGDVVTENANEGTDLVHATVSYTLPTNVENLTLDGTAAINGTGNALNNVITGNAGINLLNGGAGADTMIGGQGNDIYIVDNPGDIVTENANEGTDLVHAYVTYTLTANVERLSLEGTANINGTGNSLANIINGNTGNNVLTGGGGADTFVELKGFAQDTIMDFVAGAASGHGTIQFSASEFANFNTVLADAHQSGSDTIIQSGTDMLTLHGVTMSNLVAADFVFV